MRVYCINNKNKPNEIPQSKWDLLKEGEEYTVIEVMKCNAQGGILGFKLEEINIDDCLPYKYFAAYRFALPKEIITKKEELQETLV